MDHTQCNKNNTAIKHASVINIMLLVCWYRILTKFNTMFKISQNHECLWISKTGAKSRILSNYSSWFATVYLTTIAKYLLNESCILVGKLVAVIWLELCMSYSYSNCCHQCHIHHLLLQQHPERFDLLVSADPAYPGRWPLKRVCVASTLYVAVSDV